MKVLQLAKFFHPEPGGIETVVHTLTSGLSARGLPITVLCANRSAGTVHESWPQGFDVWRAGSLGMLHSTSMSWAMPGLLRALSRGVDVVHMHLPDPMATAAWLLVQPRARLVLHWHSDIVRQRRALRLFEPLQSRLLARADVVIATSTRYAEASAPLAAWRHKVQVVPIGISDNIGSCQPDLALALRQRWGGRRIVFALGRMRYYKGFEVLIEAACGLGDDSVVVIGGGGELAQALSHQVKRLGLQDRVFLPGPLREEELPGYFHACDVFCMPSTERSEAFGVAMLEAMAAGRPVVATDIPGSGVPWVNVDGETGFNVPVRDPAALRLALRRLLDDVHQRQYFGENARQRYLALFAAERMTDQVLELYARLPAVHS